MSETEKQSAEHAKGSVKEAIGKLTGDTEVEREGRREKKEAKEANEPSEPAPAKRSQT